MSTGKFDFESGELCLDFANTVDWHASLQPHDRLTDIYDLVAWGEAAGTLSSQEAERLQQLAEGESEKAGSAFERAVILREAIYRIFSNRAAGEDINSDDLDILNEALREAMSHLQLTIILQGFQWQIFDWLYTRQRNVLHHRSLPGRGRANRLRSPGSWQGFPFGYLT